MTEAPRLDAADRALVAGAVAAILGGMPTADAVRPALAALPDHAARRRVKDAIYGVSVLRLRLAALAGCPCSAAAAVRLVDAWLDDDGDDGAFAHLQGRARTAIARGTPRWLVDTLADSLGDEGADAFLARSNVPGPATLRANPLRVNGDDARAALMAALAAERITTRVVPDRPNALTVVGHGNLFGCEAFRRGLFEVQDASSQRVAELAAPRPGDVVVDLCAGRGGKTLALAAAMQNEGHLYAHDVNQAALRDLRGRLGRAGVTCVEVGLSAEGEADVVLVDAPCTSIGVLRRSADLRFALRASDFAPLTALQAVLTAQGLALARSGGTVVFATCSVLDDEGERVVRRVLATASTATLEHIERLAPHTTGGDGFTVAVLRKR